MTIQNHSAGRVGMAVSELEANRYYNEVIAGRTLVLVAGRKSLRGGDRRIERLRWNDRKVRCLSFT